MSCPSGTLLACDYPQFMVDQTPYFSQVIMEDIRPTDGWILHIPIESSPPGTPVEITQDRFRAVFPNTTKQWTRVQANGPGCTTACDLTGHQLGWGADRLTFYAEQQTWETPLLCQMQDMHITHARQHVDQIINDILRPGTVAIQSNFARKRVLQWAKRHNIANNTLQQFTFQWSLGGPNLDEEQYFDCSVNPNNVFMLVPQMLQNRFSPLMRVGYAGMNPFKETAPYIELVSDMDTTHNLDHLGGSQGVGGVPSIAGNWRFEQWGAANEYWRYGFSGQVGNFMVRVDEMGLRFNFVTDLGPSANGGNGNRYRYQVVLPYKNGITTGAGGSAGIGDDANPDFDRAHFRISFIYHKLGMVLRVPTNDTLNGETKFGHTDFAGRWKWLNHDFGADANGVPISNKWENKGQFGAWFQYYAEPRHVEFMEAFFHQGEQYCIPQVLPCSSDPGYPVQTYSSTLPTCVSGTLQSGLYTLAPYGPPGAGVPTGAQDGNPPTPQQPLPAIPDI
ncbi:MAG TPA: hypothetical protein VMJ12_08620 [Candidatus Acidoferrales bacterium]|nr:hypothetical protein [Candidatus Acidoferrales bacterium]